MVLLLLGVTAVLVPLLVGWRVFWSYPVSRWLEAQLASRSGSPRVLSPRRLVKAIVSTAIEAKVIGIDGVVMMPDRLTVAVAPLDVARAGHGVQGLEDAVASALIRFARRSRIRTPDDLEVDIVSDRHTLEGRPQLLQPEINPSSPAHAAYGRTPRRPLPNRTRLAVTKVMIDRNGPTRPYQHVELLSLDGPLAGRMLTDLSDRCEAVVAGREDSDLLFDSAEVSRRHARLFPESEGWAIEDLGSLNGTFVNGVRVTMARLVHNDEIQLGPDGPRMVFSRLSPDLPSHPKDEDHS